MEEDKSIVELLPDTVAWLRIKGVNYGIYHTETGEIVIVKEVPGKEAEIIFEFPETE